ncbi:rod shape-determining protein MreC [Elusimicrobium posterum]|uniref:rod shape-determining protein MreC n=1 Tax=Elusimicrobium posterum TaxID=3116653 RepID=UPI003C77DDB4
MRRNIIYGDQQTKRPFVFFVVLSILIILLPLQGLINSVKSVLYYVFVPQIRASHSTAEYFSGSFDSVKELLSAHYENTLLKEEIKETRLIKERAAEIEAQNERLSEILKINPAKKWDGVWAKIAYRDPSRWSTIIVDKGAKDGVVLRSAVIGVEDGKIGLVGAVVEEGESTSKIMLINDTDFNAAVNLEKSKTDGLLTGVERQNLKLKYIPLSAEFEKGDRVVTSKRSVVFPAGILVGTVTGVDKEEDYKTSHTLFVAPAVRPSAVREVFIITEKK